jgi:hypothetical protein
MKSAMICFTVTGLLLIGSLAGARETLVLYDNFEGKTLDPEKWFGGQGTDSGMVTLETSRLIKNETLLGSKALSLFNRSYANTDSDSEHSTASTRIFFSDGSNIKAIEATVLVKKVQVPECSTNDFVTDIRARIGGAFFNAGEPTPGSSTNDVWAQVTVGRTLDSEDPVDTLHVYARVYRCDDSNCNDVTNIGTKQDLGTAKLNKKVKLRVTWDPDTNRFIFQKGKDEESVVTYGVNDDNEPGGSNGGMKRLEIQNFLPNCTSDPRPAGYIEVSFDNVKVNAPPAP